MLPQSSFPRKLLAILACLFLGACTLTQKAPLKQEALGCGFIGPVCSQMEPGKRDTAADLRYINPVVRWTDYRKLMVDPVTFWGGETNSTTGADQQVLIDYMHQKIVAVAGKKFELVEKPGPGVMKLDVALLDADAATPALRSISMLYPQAHLLSNVAYLATGKFPFAGSLQAASKLTDSLTGQVLGAWVDRQIGGGAPTAGLQWEWGDAENAIDYWSQTGTDTIHGWTTGVSQPDP